MRPGTNVGPIRTRGGNWPAEVCGRPSSRQARLTQRPISCTGQSAVQTTKSAPAATDARPRRSRHAGQAGRTRSQDSAPRSASAATSTLRRPMSRHPVQHLPVQVAELDRVVVHRDDAAHARARESRHGPRPEPAHAQHHHGRVAQRELHLGRRSSRPTPGRRSSAAAGRSGAPRRETGRRGGIDRTPRRPRPPPPARAMAGSSSGSLGDGVRPRPGRPPARARTGRPRAAPRRRRRRCAAGRCRRWTPGTAPRSASVARSSSHLQTARSRGGACRPRAASPPKGCSAPLHDRDGRHGRLLELLELQHVFTPSFDITRAHRVTR